MMRNRNQLYWIFQAGGWGTFALANIFFAFVWEKLGTVTVSRIFIYVALGLLFTTIMREVMRRTSVTMKPLQQQILNFVLLTVLFAVVTATFETIILSFSKNLWPIYSKNGARVEFHKTLSSNIFYSVIYFFIWSCIYFIYHFIEKSRKQQVSNLKLEALVKELELKTIKSHINPHFIFNSLNSIRALIDENPGRARNAVTELSNILRSSMQADKMETVQLERELNIVKDYLALENMRFEDRLKVEYEIDEDTLDQPVPPMMLQTLVENAIKHGISKQVNGGVVKVISDFKGDYHELVVQNTGYLNGFANHEGFGLSSTVDRLNLLYGDQAHFEIKQLNPQLVEARVQIPVQIH